MKTYLSPNFKEALDVRVIGTLSLSNASLTGFCGRAAGDEGVEGGVSAIVRRICSVKVSKVSV